MCVYKPENYGAVGDGQYDDGPALNAMFADVVENETNRARIDLTGEWWVGETVIVTTPQNSHIVAGAFNALSGAGLESVLELHLGSNNRISNTMEVYGNRTSHVRNRNVVDLVRVETAQFGSMDGWTLGYAGRFGMRNATQPKSNIIGCDLGRIKAVYCGAPGIPTAAPHTRSYSTATSIVHEGQAGSPVQRAQIHCDMSTLYFLEKGDYLLINGKPQDGGVIVEVTDVMASYVEVYPWPGDLEGEGSWDVDAIIGGVKLVGGNTTQCTIQGLLAQYCGHALHISSLYGCHATAVTGEVVGSALTLGAAKAALFGASVRGLHAEITLADVLVAGPNVQRTTIISPIEEIVPGQNGYQISQTLGNGQPAERPWPVATLP